MAKQILLTIINELLIKHGLLLMAGTIVDDQPDCCCHLHQNKERSPNMHLRKKGKQWGFSMKAHIGADAEPAVAHSV